MLWTAFPDQLDTNALSLVLQIWKDKTVADPSAALLAAFNVGGFAAGKLVGQPHTMQAGAMTEADVDAAFAHARAFAAGSAGMQADGKWLKIILSVVMQVLPIILPLIAA